MATFPYFKGENGVSRRKEKQGDRRRVRIAPSIIFTREGARVGKKREGRSLCSDLLSRNASGSLAFDEDAATILPREDAGRGKSFLGSFEENVIGITPTAFAWTPHRNFTQTNENRK